MKGDGVGFQMDMGSRVFLWLLVNVYRVPSVYL